MTKYTQNNNLVVLLKDKKGVELKDWIEKNKKDLKDMRIFYVLRGNLETGDVYKVGISEKGNTSAYGRLNDYYNMMGETNKDNKCMGVKLHLVLANIFNPSTIKVKVREIETKVIKELSKNHKDRGRERFGISLDKLFETLEDMKILETDEDSEATRRSTRLKHASQDTVKAIIDHSQRTRNGDIIFTAQMENAIEYDSNQKAKNGGKPVQQPDRFVSYKELVKLREGKHLVDLYIKKHNLKK